MGGVGSRKWCSGVRDEGSQAGVDDREAISVRLGMGVEHTVGWTSIVGADGGGGKSCPELCPFLEWKTSFCV